jgi:folate-binding protein YgfZ
VRTDPGGLEFALPHFRKYGVFDDVALDDVTALTFELHLAGPRAEELVARCGGPAPHADLGHVTVPVADAPVRIIRESPTGRPGLSLIGDRVDLDRVLHTLRTEGEPLGLVDLDAATFDVLRIEAGTPVFGRDVNADNLPQEINRDARAINFVKGCYLGQETVARLDALGHVNKILKGLRCEGPEVPAPGTALEADTKPAGTITSAAFSPGWNAPVALAIVRANRAQEGTKLTVAGQRAVVVELPMLPPSGA